MGTVRPKLIPHGLTLLYGLHMTPDQLEWLIRDSDVRLPVPSSYEQQQQQLIRGPTIVSQWGTNNSLSSGG